MPASKRFGGTVAHKGNDDLAVEGKVDCEGVVVGPAGALLPVVVVEVSFQDAVACAEINGVPGE